MPVEAGNHEEEEEEACLPLPRRQQVEKGKIRDAPFLPSFSAIHVL